MTSTATATAVHRPHAAPALEVGADDTADLSAALVRDLLRGTGIDALVRAQSGLGDARDCLRRVGEALRQLAACFSGESCLIELRQVDDRELLVQLSAPVASSPAALVAAVERSATRLGLDGVTRLEVGRTRVTAARGPVSASVASGLTVLRLRVQACEVVLLDARRIPQQALAG